MPTLGAPIARLILKSKRRSSDWEGYVSLYPFASSQTRGSSGSFGAPAKAAGWVPRGNAQVWPARKESDRHRGGPGTVPDQ